MPACKDADTQPRTPCKPGSQQLPMDHPIAPTEFPKERSAVELQRGGDAARSPLHALFRWRKPIPRPTPKGGCWFGPAPEDLARELTSGQSPTDLRCARWRAPTGLRFSRASSGQAAEVAAPCRCKHRRDAVCTSAGRTGRWIASAVPRPAAVPDAPRAGTRP